MKTVLTLILLGTVIGLGLGVLELVVPRDDTDSPKERSSMVLFTDHGTGCQYLSRAIFGGLTPRMDAYGKQVCLKVQR